MSEEKLNPWGLIKSVLLGIWATLDVKKILITFWYNHAKPELEKLVARTDTKVDDYVLTAISYLVEHFFGTPEKAEEAKKALKQ
jgi:hypothetical protein